MHPLIEEICRARPDDIKASAFKRWQQHLREQIQPRLDMADRLEADAAAARGAKKPREGA